MLIFESNTWCFDVLQHLFQIDVQLNFNNLKMKCSFSFIIWDIVLQVSLDTMYCSLATQLCYISSFHILHRAPYSQKLQLLLLVYTAHNEYVCHEKSIQTFIIQNRYRFMCCSYCCRYNAILLNANDFGQHFKNQISISWIQFRRSICIGYFSYIKLASKFIYATYGDLSYQNFTSNMEIFLGCGPLENGTSHMHVRF